MLNAKDFNILSPLITKFSRLQITSSFTITTNLNKHCCTALTDILPHHANSLHNTTTLSLQMRKMILGNTTLFCPKNPSKQSMNTRKATTSTFNKTEPTFANVQINYDH